MKILVVNCGSSSLKYQLIDMEDESVIAKGRYERIGDGDTAFLTHEAKGTKTKFNNPAQNHEEALEFVLEKLLDSEVGVIKDLSEIDGVGHRLVNGGERFKKSELINEEVLKDLEAVINFAPLHNPGAISGIKACLKLMPDTPMSVVVDTSFHQTIPEERYLFPVPYKYYEKYKLRKYGAHGTSHRYVANRVAELMGRDVNNLKTVVCHLGQGASLCAVLNGKSVDTSMGLTPLGGIAMCARSGDLDPSVVTFIMRKEGLDADQVEHLLNHESGMYGVSGVGVDLRDLVEEADNNNNHRAEIAIEQFCYIVAQYIARYAVALNGIDCIAFTAGIGENQDYIRKHVCDYLEWMGVKVLDSRNAGVRGEEKLISSDDSKVEVWLVPTNEELMIAQDTMDLVKGL